MWPELTNGEKWFIARRREGWSQVVTAERLEITPFQYGQIERNKTSFVEGTIFIYIPKLTLTSAEKCVIYRRRCGFSQRFVAEDMSVSRVWVNRMERGLEKCDALVWYWEQ